MVEVTNVFQSGCHPGDGENDHFPQNPYEVTMIRKNISSIFQRNSFRPTNFLTERPWAVKIFWKFSRWRHSRIKWIKFTKMVRIHQNLLECHQKSPKQNTYGILKLHNAVPYSLRSLLLDELIIVKRLWIFFVKRHIKTSGPNSKIQRSLSTQNQKRRFIGIGCIKLIFSGEQSRG